MQLRTCVHTTGQKTRHPANACKNTLKNRLIRKRKGKKGYLTGWEGKKLTTEDAKIGRQNIKTELRNKPQRAQRTQREKTERLKEGEKNHRGHRV